MSLYEKVLRHAPPHTQERRGEERRGEERERERETLHGFCLNSVT